MHIILLSGGSGKRLWPLSNDTRSKQFIKIFKRPEGAPPLGKDSDSDYESMVQRVYRQIKTVDPDATVTIATSKSQVSSIHNQLGDGVNISVEPCRRDTFPAIALATAYLHDVMRVPSDEAVVVCPVDPYVEESYFTTLREMYRIAKEKDGIVLMGIQPTFPTEKYGYILPREELGGSTSFEFKEKPDAETARKYIEEGCLWNGGVFAYRLSYVLGKSRELMGTDSYYELYANYEKVKKISFDYAVVENESNLSIVRYNGQWKDLGTWNTLTESMEENSVGDVRMNDKCENVHAINEMGVPMLVMGCRDIVVSASPDGILVSDMEQSSYIKPFVDDIKQRVMFAEKSWGRYRVLDVGERSMTVKVTLNPGHKMNYHSHEKRDEIWTVIAGSGHTIVDGMEQPIKPGDVVTMAAGCKHTVIAGKNGLQMIEVQLGKDISVSDKKKYEFPYK
jgi:Mannose-1-phosphate guanylyltransferase